MSVNLLDLDHDILEIICGYVNKEDSFEVTDFYLKELKEKKKYI